MSRDTSLDPRHPGRTSKPGSYSRPIPQCGVSRQSNRREPGRPSPARRSRQSNRRKPGRPRPSAEISTVEPTEVATRAEAAPEISTVDGIASDTAAVDRLERFGPQAEHLRQLRLFLKATSGTHCELEPRDDPRTRAIEQWMLRNQELAAQYGIDGDRPDPVGPAPGSDGAANGATAGVPDRPP